MDFFVCSHEIYVRCLYGIIDSCLGAMIHWDTCDTLINSEGLRWYAKCLRIDEDGDVADEFLDEVLPEMTHNVDEQHKPHPRFELKYRIKPVKVKNQVLSVDGKIQQCIEHQGRLQWV
ncbi:hypothetical protein HS088_TW15G00575 [Tripterygium wilfordii]|uniref:Uncharacterized protein n=1 Tax=Tripterygium wilfordii TaxID=458696 RepID=A0A7J7CMB5_TRIWF|nr:hypothetical protein HS088_TW15G00575 [Tripterygium wilfordii]